MALREGQVFLAMLQEHTDVMSEEKRLAERMIEYARRLTEDGDGSNLEYDRAIVELVADTLGMATDDQELVCYAIGIDPHKIGKA